MQASYSVALGRDERCHHVLYDKFNFVWSHYTHTPPPPPKKKKKKKKEKKNLHYLKKNAETTIVCNNRTQLSFCLILLHYL
jgi:hypothetical protein